MGAVGGGGQRTAAAALLPRRRPGRGVAGRRLREKPTPHGTREGVPLTPLSQVLQRGEVRYHGDAAAGAGVPQVVVQQLGGPVLEGFGQSAQEHGELRCVELKQGDQHHLGCLQTWAHTHTQIMLVSELDSSALRSAAGRELMI